MSTKTEVTYYIFNFYNVILAARNRRKFVTPQRTAPQDKITAYAYGDTIMTMGGVRTYLFLKNSILYQVLLS